MNRIDSLNYLQREKPWLNRRFFFFATVLYLSDNDRWLQGFELIDVQVVQTVARRKSLRDLAINIGRSCELCLGLGQDWEVLDGRRKVV